MATSLHVARSAPAAPLTIPAEKLCTAIKATNQLASIFNAILECARYQQRNDPATRPAFDPAQLPDVIHALAIRGRDLAESTSGALFNPDVPSAEFEREVSHG